MSHIHLPDGVLPTWLWLFGWLILLAFLFLASALFKKDAFSRKIPYIAMLSSLMVIAMSLEILPIAYHINLSVVSGIILGPVTIIIASFIVNLILAFFGHGGISVVGVNTIILSIEGICGYFLFRLFFYMSKRVGTAAFLATFLSLLLATTLAIGIIAIGAKDIREPLHQEKLSSQIIKFNLIEKEAAHEFQREGLFDLKRFTFIVYAFGLVGWLLEAFISAMVVLYISKVKKGILNI